MLGKRAVFLWYMGLKRKRNLDTGPLVSKMGMKSHIEGAGEEKHPQVVGTNGGRDGIGAWLRDYIQKGKEILLFL